MSEVDQCLGAPSQNDGESQQTYDLENDGTLQHNMSQQVDDNIKKWWKDGTFVHKKNSCKENMLCVFILACLIGFASFFVIADTKLQTEIYERVTKSPEYMQCQKLVVDAVNNIVATNPNLSDAMIIRLNEIYANFFGCYEMARCRQRFL